MEAVISPGNMYHVLIMETQEMVYGILSASNFMEVPTLWKYQVDIKTIQRMRLVYGKMKAKLASNNFFWN